MEGEVVSHRMTKGKRLLLISFCFFLAFPLFSLKLRNNGYSSSEKIQIIATVFPLLEMARSVVGERGEVSLLLPPGAEVHSWQPRPSDILRLATADLFIYVGASLEPWVPDILRSVSSPKLTTLEVSRGLAVIKKEKKTAHQHPHEAVIDPHVWLDFENDQKITDRIAELLSSLFPAGTQFFSDNALVYKQKLEQLDRKYSQALASCEVRTFIIGGHAAFGYLASRYNLNQVALYGISPDSKPTPKQLVEVVKLAKTHQIMVIYFEEYVSDELARVISREVGARTLVLNAGANISRDQLKSGRTFLEIMEKNLENLRDGLICR